MSYLFNAIVKEDEVTQEDFDKMLAASPVMQAVAELNAAIVRRLDLFAVASGTDAQGYANMNAAHDDLKAKGLVP